jgi:hypothetical protein
LIPSLRQRFNATWSPEKFSRFLRILESRYGEPTPFRHSETPCFLADELVNTAARYGSELVEQLLANPEYQAASRDAIPAAYRVPNEDPVPLFVQADFGLDAKRNLKLVEIQGFPSLYGYQLALSDAYGEAYQLDKSLAALPGGLSRASYEHLFRRAVVGNHDPQNVVLMEIDPRQQKTRHDFTETQRMLGIGVVDARVVVKKGSRLFYRRGAVDVPIERIYNRVIADELERRKIELPFDFRDDLEVEWAGHPNWFFRLSKFSLPYFRHEAAPPSLFLSSGTLPDDLAQWVLKPLYSFAGVGVIVGPSQEDIARIPPSERHNYILQRRVEFHPWIETPEGPTKLELRVMYIWLDKLQPANLIIRMGRGAQMGVDHNKGLGWVGASAAFIGGNYGGEKQ